MYNVFHGVAPNTDDLKFPERSENNEDVRKYNVPQPPKIHSNKLKCLSFMNHRLSSPQLLSDLNLFIESGLRNLKKNECISQEAKLDVFRNAFQIFIDEFNIYRPFLQSVKNEYDNAIEILIEKVHGINTDHAELEAKEIQYTIEKNDLIQQHNIQIKELEDTNQNLQVDILKRDKEILGLFDKIESQKTVISRLEVELIGAKNNLGLLTRGINTMDEDKKRLDERSQSHSAEISIVQIAIKKANDELTR